MSRCTGVFNAANTTFYVAWGSDFKAKSDIIPNLMKFPFSISRVFIVLVLLEYRRLKKKYEVHLHSKNVPNILISPY